MGEVYRARDRKLGRDVAIKVLPAAFAQDPERLARFQREAQVLATLNHPNIAHIYGLEETAGGRALVMELVEGETLAQRIARGAAQLEEAVTVVKQIAEGLEYAHDKGIIHRDLKPANVKITPEGAVKILDFGLAKAVEDRPAPEDIANSPTLSMAATRAGIILGTAAYMSPEQAHGKPADRRSDLWSLGAILYEMLTGRAPFAGESVSDILASVLKTEPDWNALPAATPSNIRKLVRRCLIKDRRQRVQSAGEFRLALDEKPEDLPIATPVRQSAIFNLQSAISVVLAVVALFALGFWRRAAQPVPRPLVRLNVDLGPEASLESLLGPPMVISPDGMRIAYVGTGADRKTRLYTRRLDQTQALMLTGTEGGLGPIFSPDGQWIAFFADGKLKKISVQGGTAVALCDAGEGRGASWGEDGSIVLAPATTTGLFRVSASGGPSTPVTQLNKEKGEATHRWPQILPGGQSVLFTASSRTSYDDAEIVVQSLKDGKRKTVHQGGTFGRYLESGHLIYARQSTLFAAPMDLGKLELTGPSLPLLEEVVTAPTTGAAQLSVSQTGTLVYMTGKTFGSDRVVAWLDSSGKTQRVGAVPGPYFTPRFSPDGKRLAISVIQAARSGIWIYDLVRDTLSRLTFSQTFDSWPVWTPDGKHIVFSSSRGGGQENIYWIRSDGAGEAQRLTENKNRQIPRSFTPDGKRLVYHEGTPDAGPDLWTLPLDLSDPEHPKPGKPEVFLRTPTTEVLAAFSPDGRWLAYMSGESGTDDVYVRPFPGPGGKWQVSNGGGNHATWSPNGRELYYRTPDGRLMVANYAVSGDTFQSEKPRVWSEKRFLNTGIYTNFDIAPDGKRFVGLFSEEGEQDKKVPTQAVFLLNFFDELRRKVPGK